MKRQRVYAIMLGAVLLATFAMTDEIRADNDSLVALQFTEYPAPPFPEAITTGPDGALWFTYYANGIGGIGRITTMGAMTLYSTPMIDLSRIASGPDGALWFTLGTQIGHITTTGSYNGYPVPNPFSSKDITAGPDHAMWFTESGNDQFLNSYVGRINTFGVITQYVIAQPPDFPVTYSNRIIRSSGRDLWFTALGGAENAFESITPGGSVTLNYHCLCNSLLGIATGPDGALWATVDNGVNQIERITTAGMTTLYQLPNGGGPQDIVRGADGALWFTEATGNRIGRITTAGSITEYTIPTTNCEPWGITVGPDRAIWFTEKEGNKIGRFGRPMVPAN